MIDFDKLVDDAISKADRISNEILMQYKKESSTESQQDSYTNYNLITLVLIGCAAVSIPTCYMVFKHFAKTKTAEQYQDIPLNDFTSVPIEDTDTSSLLGNHEVVVLQ